MTWTLAQPVLRKPTRPGGEAVQSRSIVLEGIDWERYVHLSQELHETRVRITYDDERMEIMTPPIENLHDQHKKFVARLIETYALFGRLELTGIGSTVLRKKELLKGIEPDECYYVKSKAPPMSAKKILESGYPPPDLGIEVDDTSSSLPRQPIFAAIGVSEIWRVKDGIVTILHLQSNGKYREFKKSLSFPGLGSADVNRFFKLASETSQSLAIFAFWDWLQARK